ncbi:hypothetical protein [Aliivibrio fischeri]|uniref:hypothetical protein n=1 Tax=Aliivibrio fischeri TaxID=668 RepID=UPI00080ECB88|nr:hypothetical protein [Aliivibrio fischeri]OCH37525.1 hypothetical protein A6D99_13760 [Aliivibrio fischeri]
MNLSDLNKPIFIFIFMILFLGSFITFKTYNILPVNYIIDFLIVLLFLLSIKKNGNINSVLVISLCIFSFLLSSYLYNIFYIGVNLKDYFIANKSIFYLLLITMFVNRKVFDNKFIYSFYKLILIVFLIKYILWLMFGPFNRPGVFFENNFELPFLLFIYLTLLNLDVKVSNIYHVLLFVIFILSGSLSGFLALSVLFFILNVTKIDKYFIFKCCVTIFIVGALLFVIRTRVTNIETLDRFIFLQELIYNFKDKHISDFIIGNIGLSPLRQDTCNMLSFYSSLFSQSNDGTCYSVILHSYILRILYDHGFIGLFLIFILLYVALLKSNLKINISISAIAIIIVNSLSVSGLNNTFIAIGIILLITSYEYRGNNVSQCRQ